MTSHRLLLAVFLMALWLGSALAVAESRGTVVRIPGPDGKEVALYQGSFALLIGASAYTNGWPKLPQVPDDLRAVRAVLERQGFAVTEVIDPDHRALRRAFDEFINAHGADEDSKDNRLLFYFAGHGHTLDESFGGKMGYILPVDTPPPQRDLAGFRATALDMQQIETYARRIQAKHALFVFDSCFSGSIFALSRGASEHISYKAARPVRQFITSGGADEKVPDQSLFRAQWVAALDGEGDLTGDGYVTGAELGLFLQNTVAKYSRGSQHPQYGTLRDPRLDKGDFVFQVAAGAAPAARAAEPIVFQAAAGAVPAARSAEPVTASASTTVPETEPADKPWYARWGAWIKEESSWLFSGIGAMMVIGVLGWLIRPFVLRSKTMPSPDAAPNIEPVAPTPPPPPPQPSPLRTEPPPTPSVQNVRVEKGGVSIGGHAIGNTIVTGKGNTVNKS